jgi:hypothetical protein
MPEQLPATAVRAAPLSITFDDVAKATPVAASTHAVR